MKKIIYPLTVKKHADNLGYMSQPLNKIVKKAMSKWGKKGGKKRAHNLTPEERRRIASLGGQAKNNKK